MKLPAMVLVSGLLAGSLWARQAPAIPAGTEVKIELQKKVDSKKSKVGDKVVAKLSQDLKVNGAEIAPKNSLLLGTVTAVTPSDHGAPAKLGILFNQLVPKKGAPIAVRAAIVKVYSDNQPPAMQVPTEMGGSGASVTFDPGNPKYIGMDRSTDGIPIQYGVMETADGTGPDLGGVIQSVGENFNLDDGTHVQVRFLHN